MVAAVGVDAYREQIGALLPRGRAWPRERATTLGATTEAIAQELADIDRQAVRLLDELLAGSTFDLITDWEADLGLPDACSVLGSTITIRRASLLEKIVTRADLSAGTFREIGRRYGVEIRVFELDEHRAARSTTLDTTGGRWRFVWWVTIPTAGDARRFDTLSDVNTPLVRGLAQHRA